MTDATPVDLRRFTSRYPVRQHELDLLGHVNNAVYLNWAEQVAIDHVEALGFGRDWATERGGGWVVREHRITYHRPVRYGDVVLVTTMPQQLAGVRGVRRTEIHRESDGALMAEAITDWIWVRFPAGRPGRVPPELLKAFGEFADGPPLGSGRLERSALGTERSEQRDHDARGKDE